MAYLNKCKVIHVCVPAVEAFDEALCNLSGLTDVAISRVQVGEVVPCCGGITLTENGAQLAIESLTFINPMQNNGDNLECAMCVCGELLIQYRRPWASELGGPRYLIGVRISAVGVCWCCDRQKCTRQTPRRLEGGLPGNRF